MYDRDGLLASVDLPALADELAGPRCLGFAAPTWHCPSEAHAPQPDGTAEIVIFSTRRGGQRWQCATCGAGGTAVDLVMASQGVSIARALEVLAGRVGAEPLPATFRYEPDVAVGVSTGVHRQDLDAWVARAGDLLWQPQGEPVRCWLTETRGLPEDVLRANHIGATTITPDGQLPTRRSVAGRRAASPAAVLPTRQRRRAVHAQLRLIDPPSHSERYVTLPGTTARPPDIGLFRPARRLHPEIIVTEGVIDALSANAAGYRAVAILGPGRADAQTASRLVRLDGRLVLALDADSAGEAATDRLARHLTAIGRRPTVLSLPDGDLNEALVAASNWPRKLAAHVDRAAAAPQPGPSLGF